MLSPGPTTTELADLITMMSDYLNTETGGVYNMLSPQIMIDFLSASGPLIESLSKRMQDVITEFGTWIEGQATEAGDCISENNTIADAAGCIVGKWGITF